MPAVTFDWKSFLKIILLFYLLTWGWTVLCIENSEFTYRDTGLLSGFGYLAIFSASFYFGLPLKRFFVLPLLIILFGLIFLISSFGLGILFLSFTKSMPAFFISSAVLSSTLLLVTLHTIYGVGFRMATGIAVIATSLFAAYILQHPIYESSFKRMELFVNWQGLVILPLALGVTIHKKQSFTSIH